MSVTPLSISNGISNSITYIMIMMNLILPLGWVRPLCSNVGEILSEHGSIDIQLLQVHISCGSSPGCLMVMYANYLGGCSIAPLVTYYCNDRDFCAVFVLFGCALTLEGKLHMPKSSELPVSMCVCMPI